MSFTFISDEQFEWPVTVCKPQGGEHVETVFKGLFESLDEEEFYKAPEVLPTTSSEVIDFEIAQLMRVFKGWPDGELIDGNGDPIRATPATIRAFLGKRPNRLAVTEAYQTAITPTIGQRAKN